MTLLLQRLTMLLWSSDATWCQWIRLSLIHGLLLVRRRENYLNQFCLIVNSYWYVKYVNRSPRYSFIIANYPQAVWFNVRMVVRSTLVLGFTIVGWGRWTNFLHPVISQSRISPIEMLNNVTMYVRCRRSLTLLINILALRPGYSRRIRPCASFSSTN